MLSVQQAREKIIAAMRPVPAETVSLSAAGGRVLAADIHADADLPPFDNASVDGFAVCTPGLAAAPASPITLRVVADIAAGDHPQTPLTPGQAARIMTGAALPPGADAVVMVEDTDFHNRTPGAPAPQHVTLTQTPSPGENIRPRGSDLVTGQRVLPAGRRLAPQDLGLLAMLGAAQVMVRREPRLALLSSGDELLPPEAPLVPGKIRDANSTSLAALAACGGAQVFSLGIAADNAQDVRSRLDQAVALGVDLIVSSAGVSVGAFDFVKSVVESSGQIDFWKVNMRPGKPLAVGSYRGIPFIGLPGNPVSAFIGFMVFVQPALDRLTGLGERMRNVRHVLTAQAIESDGRESYLRAIVTLEDDIWVARLTGHQGSGNLLSLVQANALLIVPSGVKSVPPKTVVDAWMIT